VDGKVVVEDGEGLDLGDVVRVGITASDEYDLYGRLAA
jgi:hypothetical protein